MGTLVGLAQDVLALKPLPDLVSRVASIAVAALNGSINVDVADPIFLRGPASALICLLSTAR